MADIMALDRSRASKRVLVATRTANSRPLLSACSKQRSEKSDNLDGRGVFLKTNGLATFWPGGAAIGQSEPAFANPIFFVSATSFASSTYFLSSNISSL
jgi:hypothetical protein